VKYNKLLIAVVLITIALLSILQSQTFAQFRAQDDYLNAIKLMNQNKTEAAIIEFKNILAKTDNQVWTAAVLFYLGKCYYKLNNYIEAKTYLDRIVKNYKTSQFFTFAKEMLADIDSKIVIDNNSESKLKETNNTANPSKQSEKRPIVNYQDKTITNIDSSKKQLTEEELKKLQTLEKIVREGNDYYNNGNYTAALESFKSAYSIEPNNSVVKFNLGITLLKLNNFAEANIMLEDVYKKNPDDNEALRYVAYTYMKLDKPILALIYWKRLLKLLPNDAQAIEYVKKIENIENVK